MSRNISISQEALELVISLLSGSSESLDKAKEYLRYSNDKKIKELLDENERLTLYKDYVESRIAKGVDIYYISDYKSFIKEFSLNHRQEYIPSCDTNKEEYIPTKEDLLDAGLLEEKLLDI
jgi:predicted HTH domain antitoxin